MTYSDRRRGFLRGVAAAGAAVGLGKLIPDAVAVCPPSQICPPSTPGFLLQRTGQSYVTLQQAANAAQNGDTIFVTPGTYFGNVNCAGIFVNLTIKSAVQGQKWRIDTSGERTASGGVAPQGYQQNGLIVKKGSCTQLVVEDCEFFAAILVYDNFAGLYTEGNNWQVTLRRCHLRGCDNGMLINSAIKSNPNDISSITLEQCIFEACGDGTGTTHNIYVGDIASLMMTGCYSARCDSGHLLKTRAKQTTLVACRFTGEGGMDSFSADFSNAGDVSIIGCIFEQGIKSENPVMITYGRELQFWGQWPDNRLNRFRMYQSTVVNDLGYGTPLELYVTPVTKDIQDNVWAGANSPSYANNSIVALSNFEDAISQDYRLNTPIVGSRNWAQLEYVHPAQVKPRSDTDRGAVSPQTLPFWATAVLLPSGTWYERDAARGGNTPFTLPRPKTLAPRKYDAWIGFTDDCGSGLMALWTGGVFSPDYSNYGAAVFLGGGHTVNESNFMKNSIIAWNGDTGLFEWVKLPWFDINAVLPGGPGANQSPGVTPGLGNPRAKLRWGQAVGWASMQLDVDLHDHGELVAGEIPASHYYQILTYLPPAGGGGPKGSIFSPIVNGAGSGGGDYAPRSHIYDLNSKTTWTRFTAPPNEFDWSHGPPPFQNPVYSSQLASCTDSTRNVVYVADQPGNLIAVADGRGGTQKVGIAHLNSPSLAMPGDDGVGFEFVPHPTDPLQDIVVSFTTRFSGSPPGGFYYILLVAAWAKDLVPGQTFVPFSLTQGGPTPPIDRARARTGVPGTDFGPRWSGFRWCKDLNALCMFDVVTTTMWKLTIPTDRKLGTYVWSSETLTTTHGGVAPTVWDQNSTPRSNSVGMYTKMMYWPKAKAFTIGVDVMYGMRILRPTGLI